MPIRPTRAFTLIELLIVVAIIAILAAIAVPNFLEAQTRAKVARCKADMRSVTTGIESYRIDWNRYPLNEFNAYLIIPHTLTTPVAYFTVQPVDPFAQGRDVSMGLFDTEDELLTYWNIITFAEGAQFTAMGFMVDAQLVDSNAGGNRRARLKYGDYYLSSVGPDGLQNDPATSESTAFLPAPTTPPWGYSFDVSYDPTNGTISFGNIIRTQINGEGTRPDPGP